MTKSEIKQAIRELPAEKQQRIFEMICKVSSLINSIECELLDTKLANHSLIIDRESPTLWTMAFQVKKVLFEHKLETK